MDITSAQYTIEGYIDAVIDGLHRIVPDDMANRHRQALADWVAEGNTILPYAPTVPQNITSSPDSLFGGPTMKEVFHGNQ